MTVADLIKLLESKDPNMKVFISRDLYDGDAVGPKVEDGFLSGGMALDYDLDDSEEIIIIKADEESW